MCQIDLKKTKTSGRGQTLSIISTVTAVLSWCYLSKSFNLRIFVNTVHTIVIMMIMIIIIIVVVEVVVVYKFNTITGCKVMCKVHKLK